MTAGLVKAGAAAGTTIATGLIAPQTTLRLGGSSNLWGTTWTKAQIEVSGFGFYIWVEAPGGGAKYEAWKASLRVFYSIGSSTITQDAVLYASRVTEARWDGCYREDTTTSAYTRVSEETGDLPRIPPSGMEQRPCELLIVNSRGLMPEPGGNEAGEEDPAIDKIQAQISYRPAYIGRI